MKNRNLLNFMLGSAAINTGLWAATITVGLMGCYGSMTIAQCAYTWVVITAGALIAKILIGINLLQAKEEAARGNGRQIRKNTYSNTSIIPPAKFKSQGVRRMNAADFVKTSVLLGYCDKKTALDYTIDHPKQDYNDDDYIEVYRRYEKKIVKDGIAKKVASPAHYLSTRTSRVYTGVWRW